MKGKVLQVSVDIEYDEDIISREELYEKVLEILSKIGGVVETLGSETCDMTREYQDTGRI